MTPTNSVVGADPALRHGNWLPSSVRLVVVEVGEEVVTMVVKEERVVVLSVV